MFKVKQINKKDVYFSDILNTEHFFTSRNLIVKDNRKINVVDGLSLEVKAGEILGIAGIDGNGQSELVEALTGLRKVTSGIIEINGEAIVIGGRVTFKSEIMPDQNENIPEDNGNAEMPPTEIQPRTADTPITEE